MASGSSRRSLLAASAALLGLAGCTDRSSTTSPTPSDPPTDATPATGTRTDSPDRRRTQTPRHPEPLPVSGSWPQYGNGPGHAGATSASGVPNDATPYWHLTRMRSGPVVLSEDRIFHYAELGDDAAGQPTVTRTKSPPPGTAHHVEGDPAVVCRGAAAGRIRWVRRIDGPGVRWPGVGDDRVVVGVNGQLAAFDVADGSEIWSHDLGDRIVSDPTIAAGLVILPFSSALEGSTERVQPEVRAYRLADGHHEWTVEPPSGDHALAADVDSGTLVVAATDDEQGVLTARSLPDGRRDWRREVAGAFLGPPSIAGGAIFVTTTGGALAVHELRDGTQRWTHTVQEWMSEVTVDDEACVLSAGGELLALDVQRGTVRWSASPEDDRSFGGTPALGREAVYLERSGHPADVVAIGRDEGTPRWSLKLPTTVVDGDIVTSGLETQPTVAENGVYAYAADGLYAFGPG